MRSHQHTRHVTVRALGLVCLILLGAVAPGANATQQDDASIVASGLTNPRGFVWGADGTMFIGLAGDGVVTVPATPSSELGEETVEGTPVVEGVGEVQVGTTTASVARIENGCAITVAGGLPSGGPPDIGWTLGVDDLEIVGDTLYALVGGGGEVYGHPDQPNGVYQVNADGSTVLVADLSAWFRANPVAEPHEPISPDAQPFSMVAIDGVLWIAEANHQQVLTVTADGTVTRIADLSVLGNVAPAGIAPAPEGGVYVGFLAPLPFADGSAWVVHVADDGTVTDAWTNLTAVTSIAVGDDGTLYALEMATGNTSEPPFVAPGTGKVVRQTGPDSAEEVVTGLTFPVKMAFGPDGGLYVGYPAFGATSGEGAVARFDLTGGSVIDASGLVAPTSCFG